LHALGYALALDDFTPQSEAELLLPYVRFVKLDVLTTAPDLWAPLAARLRPLGVRLVAEKVETAETVREAAAAGCTLFQGFYFCRPTTVSASALPTRRLAYLNLLAALSRPDLTILELEDLVKHDVSLTYRVLRCVNSAAFGIAREIHTIRQALIL